MVSLSLQLNLLTVLAAAGITAATLPGWRQGCRRIGLVDDPGGRKEHAQPTPLAGGLAMLSGIFATLLAGAFALQLHWLPTEMALALNQELSTDATRLGAVLGGAAAMTCLGWLDDRFDLPPFRKFAGQMIIAGLVTLAGLRLPFGASLPLVSGVCTVLWIVGVTNALNFTDNMNGLCAGLGLIASICFAMPASTQPLVAALAWLSAGAALGFLPWNFPRATAFLGDAGSHLIGYLLAVLAILPESPAASPDSWPLLRPALILAVPLADLLWVTCYRGIRGRPVYVGDTNHLSHQLVRCGFSHAGAVLVLWLAAAGTGAVALWLTTRS